MRSAPFPARIVSNRIARDGIKHGLELAITAQFRSINQTDRKCERIGRASSVFEKSFKRSKVNSIDSILTKVFNAVT